MTDNNESAIVGMRSTELDIRMAVNGVWVHAIRNDMDKAFASGRTLVFNDPEQFGQWCAAWMRMQLVRPPT